MVRWRFVSGNVKGAAPAACASSANLFEHQVSTGFPGTIGSSEERKDLRYTSKPRTSNPKIASPCSQIGIDNLTCHHSLLFQHQDSSGPSQRNSGQRRHALARSREGFVVGSEHQMKFDTYGKMFRVCPARELWAKGSLLRCGGADCMSWCAWLGWWWCPLVVVPVVGGRTNVWWGWRAGEGEVRGRQEREDSRCETMRSEKLDRCSCSRCSFEVNVAWVGGGVERRRRRSGVRRLPSVTDPNAPHHRDLSSRLGT